MKKWFVYMIPPIDFNWNFLLTIEETASKISQEYNNSFLNRNEMFDNTFDYAGFRDDFDQIENDLAIVYGLRGLPFQHIDEEIPDIKKLYRHSPYVFWIPCDSEFEYGFVFKFDDSGTTIIYSPVEMNWLDDRAQTKTISELYKHP